MLWASLYWKSLYSLQDFELKDCSIGVSFLTGYHKEDGADWPKVLWDASRFGLKMPLSEAFKRAFLKSSDGIFHWRRKLLPNMLRVRTLNELQANFERTLSQSSEPKFKKKWGEMIRNLQYYKPLNGAVKTNGSPFIPELFQKSLSRTERLKFEFQN